MGRDSAFLQETFKALLRINWALYSTNISFFRAVTLLDFEFRLIDSITEIDPEDYSRLINTDNPFVQFDFFKTLEDSAAIGHHSGWITQHLIVLHNNKLIAFLPLFIRTNSYGEYVFDFEWAKAYHSYGLNYYPKLTTAIPFTPSAGQRIFYDPAYKNNELFNAIYLQIKHITQKNQYSSWHLLFPRKSEHEELNDKTLLKRLGVQFHWFNHDYKNFDDFLCRLTHKRRKNIKRERKQVYSQGLTLSNIEGKDVSPALWKEFYLFYQLTYAKKSGHSGYLPADFFTLIGQRMPEKIVMITVKSNQKVVAAALCFKDNNTLYGRYWGCRQEFEYLHFETCYYQGIEYCIQHKLKKFDAGAQGGHKVQRGFEPVYTYSNHWIKDKPFREAINNFLVEEQQYTKSYFQHITEKTPFKAI